ncbi:MAG: ribosome small subunit-dependent GTPase A [Chloroflexota bacterium]|nr:ribosome small subunit-dependent GTPase A [Chloroflexota bacterium]
MARELAGLVVKEQSGFFWVEAEDGSTYTCRLRGRLLEAAQSSDVAAIGDRVRIEVIDDDTGAVEAVEPRTSALSRAVRTEGNRGAGAAEREQVIIANADQAVFVFAAASPTPSLRMLDRFLVMGEKSDIERLVIIVNKVDLEGAAPTVARFDLYRTLGYTVLHTSALRGEGVTELRDLLKDHISVFTGPSGVGKSSLLNSIEPGLARVVKNVSEVRQEGLHTTRDSALIKLASGGYLADTPGIRTLTLWDIEPEELDGYFPELAPLVPQCRFADCEHRNEPGCAVRAALQKGTISHSRYQSYLSIRDELEAALDAMY